MRPEDTNRQGGGRPRRPQQGPARRQAPQGRPASGAGDAERRQRVTVDDSWDDGYDGRYGAPAYGDGRSQASSWNEGYGYQPESWDDGYGAQSNGRNEAYAGGPDAWDDGYDDGYDSYDGYDDYEPRGPRQYRADDDPARARRRAAGRQQRAAATVQAGGVLQAAARFQQEILLIVVLLLAFISILVGVASCSSSAGSNAKQESQIQEQQAQSAQAERIASAETSVDENGIVHGVTSDGVKFTIHGAGEAAHQADKVTFAAAGDQIATDYSLELADSWSGEAGDGKYDFKPFYTEVKPYFQGSDIRYISQETTLIGGQDGWDVSGYPTFVSPEACAEAIADTGFNLVNFTSNHSYDAGEEGIVFSQKVWAKYPQIIIGGSFPSQEARETVQLIERNGIRFAFLAYSYGDNAYDNPSDEPNSYYAVAFDEKTAGEDIARAQQVADCVIVSMHWGEEYNSEATDEQKKQAQWLADQGVDLVVGTHAHSIQPVEYYSGVSGNRTPVVFGLGDFVSGWTLTDTILSGIFTCDFVKQDDGHVTVENPTWHPTIEWSDGSDKVFVRLLENLTVDQINANTRTEDWPESSFKHIYEFTNSVIKQIPVNWGADADEKAKAASSDADNGDTAAAIASNSGSSSSASSSSRSDSSRSSSSSRASGNDANDEDSDDVYSTDEDDDASSSDDASSDESDDTTSNDEDGDTSGSDDASSDDEGGSNNTSSNTSNNSDAE